VCSSDLSSLHHDIPLHANLPDIYLPAIALM